ncbi:unnamed protein product [Penicillium glandicola]
MFQRISTKRISAFLQRCQDGNPQFLSPEEEVERHHRLQQAVREKMLGLPRTTIFEWHQGTSETSTGTDELQLPPYTPPEDEKK